MSARARFVEHEAPALADRAAGTRTEPFEAAGRISRAVALRVAGDTLVLVHAPGESRKQDELALAYGLTWQGDRDLLLVLPAKAIPSTLLRLSAIETPVRVFDHDLVEHLVPARVDACRALRRDERLRLEVHDLREHRATVETLVSGLGLTEAHRESYCAWHFEGREVLRAQRTRRGLRLDGELRDTAGLRQELERRVAARVGDERNAEHRLQAWLDTDEGRHALRMRRLVRELPCSRPGRRRTYMDLLGVDARGDLHLIETKLGYDPMLALQALDYWLWLQGSLDLVREHLGLQGRTKVIVDFLVTPVCLRYLMPLAEAFHTDLRWRVGMVGDGEVRWIGRTGQRRKSRLQARLGALSRRDPVLVERARPALEALEKRHRYLLHARSSQAFALNLFGGLGAVERLAVGRLVEPGLVEVSDAVFELEDEHDRLGEGERYRTQIDVAFRGVDQAGASWLILVEVKLSEADFSTCGGFRSERNRRREVCSRSDGFGHPDCHLARRGYAQRVSVREDLGCAVRTSTNQVMRQAALGAVFAEEVDHVVVALCAPREHGVIWRRWREAVERITAPVRFAALPANAVLGLVGDDLAEHYGLSVESHDP